METNYLSPPIREAIFDIRVKTHNITQTDIEKLHPLIEVNYPIKKKKLTYSGEIILFDNPKVNLENNNKEEVLTPEFKGLIFTNKKGNRHVQFRVDGFTLNYLPPYTNWGDFFAEAVSLWQIYFKNIKVLEITRIALRYINRINIPMPFDNLNEYVVNIPPIPKCLPQSVSNFFMQIEVPCDDDFQVIITETIESPNLDYLPFILDIDVYKNVSEDFDIDDFHKIRKMKNSIFEDFITDKTRKLFGNE